MNSEEHAPRPGTPEFDAAVRRLAPWWFAFEAEGHSFGGQTPRDTDKVRIFFEWIGRCGGRASRILDLGSHEGHHALQLAGHPGVEEVLGLEGRAENLERARFVQSVFGVVKIDFRLYNLERFDPADIGPFDAVFCSGLLYHLPEPWAFLEALAPACRFLFLDTHYAPTDDDQTDRYRGRWWTEETSDPLSGLSPRSFWLSFRHLMMLLLSNGLLVRFVRDHTNGTYSRAWIFAERVGSNGAACEWTQETPERGSRLCAL